ncbi:HEAT repeat domain-containing protein [Gordonia sp. DT30]|uniref:HEAT repeat domain-containing protein n=1 Tax=unclassified Gordonia (in: high G+C Gram-positive bacteria) TaxID=2657482 RepID=UPI003CF5A88E
MNAIENHSTNRDEHIEQLLRALGHPDPSVRLRAAMSVGAFGSEDPADQRVSARLIEQSAVEPDFFVRDMLTWALCRQPADVTVPRLLAELDSGTTQAKSQALHTLSKIGDQRAWPRVAAMLHDADDEVARAAWRAAIALAPADAVPALAGDLAMELGRRLDEEARRSLSRALVALGAAGYTVAEAASSSADEAARTHARATVSLFDDPDAAFTESLEQARRVAIRGVDADR